MPISPGGTGGLRIQTKKLKVSSFSEPALGAIADDDRILVLDDSASDVVYVTKAVLYAGLVEGPSSTTDNTVARYDGTSGDIQTSSIVIDDSSNITGVANLTITGDFVIGGSTTTVNTATLSVEDPLIILASNNDAADAVDIGFYGLYDTSGSQDLYAGFFRDTNDNKFHMFTGLQAAPTTTVNLAGTGYTKAGLVVGALEITSFGANWTNAGRTVADLGIITTVDINGGTVGGVTLDGTISGTPTWASTQSLNTSGNAATVTTNANLTGHITSSGNAAVLGSFTSAQLLGALTNETGSGVAVFNTSPTLITPALGTPASGVMTNVSGTASSLTAGTVTTNANLTGVVTSSGNATSIAAKALALSKLADGTDGQLVTWGTDGVITTIAVGSSGQVLTSAGADAVPTWATPTVGDITSVVAGTGLSGGATSGAATLNVDAAQTQITSVGALNAGSITSGFTSIDVGAGAITTTGALSIGTMGTNWTNAGRTVADLGIVTTADINGGSIDGAAIGANTAAAGTFTTVVVSSATDSTSGTTGAINTLGGVGITKDLYVGGDIGINVAPTSGYFLEAVRDGGDGATRRTAYRAASGQVSDYVRFARGSAASPTVSINGDTIYQLVAYGYSGAASAFVNAARLKIQLDGVPDSSGDTTDMPGRIVFETVPNGSNVLTEALRLDSSQNATFAGDVVLATSGNATLSVKALDSGTSAAGLNLYGYRTAGDADDVVRMAFYNQASGDEKIARIDIKKDSASVTDAGAFEFYTNNGTSENLALTLDSSQDATFAGNVGIGTTTADALLHVYQASAGSMTADASGDLLVLEDTSSNGMSFFMPDSSSGMIMWTSPSSSGTRAAEIAFSYTGGSLRMVTRKVGATNDFYADNAVLNLTLSGASGSQLATFAKGLVVGHTAQVTTMGDIAELQVVGTGAADSSMALVRNSANSAGPQLLFAKSRNASTGSFTIVSDGDVLGHIRASADDGVDFVSESARITFAVDGTPGANDTPGRIVFSTAIDGAQVVTERMRLDASGKLLLSDSTIAHGLTSILATNTYSRFGVQNSTNGGFNHTVVAKDAALGTVFAQTVYGGTATNDKTILARSLFEVTTAEHNGSNAVTAVTGNGNIFGVRAYRGSTYDSVFVIDEDGDTYQDGDIWGMAATTIGTIGGNLTLDPATDVLIANGHGLVVGHTAQVAIGGTTAEFQVLGTVAADGRMALARFNNTSDGPRFQSLKSRDPVIADGTFAIVQDNDILMEFEYFADDGVDFDTRVATHIIEVDDASPAAGDIGTAFVWASMPGGGGAIGDILRLAANKSATFYGQVIAESSNDANSVNLSFQNPAVDGSHIQYAFSKRSDNEDLWLYAYDGSAYWNALKFDHGATKLIVDGDLEFTGAQKITTSSSDLTLDPAGIIILSKDIRFSAALDIDFQANTGSALQLRDTAGFAYATFDTRTTVSGGQAYYLDISNPTIVSASGSYWRTMQLAGHATTWTGGVDITTNIDGDALYLAGSQHTSTSSTTIAQASTLYVAAPTQSGSVTITSKLAAEFDGAVLVTGPILFSSGNGLFTSPVTGITTNSADLLLEAVDNMGFMIGSDTGNHIFDWSTGGNFGGSATQLMTLTASSGDLNVKTGNIIIGTAGDFVGADATNSVTFSASGVMNLNGSGQTFNINIDADNDSTTTSFNIYKDAVNGGGTKLMSLTEASVLNFPAATTISTAATTLTLDPTTDVIIPDGKGLVVGHTAQVTTNMGTHDMQILGNSAADAGLTIGNFSSTASDRPVLAFLKGKSNTIGTPGIIAVGDTLAEIQFLYDDGNDFANIAAKIRISAVAGSTYAGNTASADMKFYTSLNTNSPAERLRIDSAGRLNVGGTANFSMGSLYPQLLVAGIDDNTATIAASHDANNSVGPSIVLSKSRDSIGADSPTIVNNNDKLGTILFTGADGVNRSTIVGQIQVLVDDASPAANSIAGEMIFSTAKGAGTDDITPVLTLSPSGNATFAGDIVGTDSTTITTTSSTLLLDPTTHTIMTGEANSVQTLTISETGTSGVNIRMIGSGATTPNKSIRVHGGDLQVVNHAYSAVIYALADNGDATFTGDIYSDGATTISTTAGDLTLAPASDIIFKQVGNEIGRFEAAYGGWTDAFKVSGSTAGDATSIIIDALSGYDSDLIFEEAGTWKYIWGYDASANYMRLTSTDMDGSGSNKDVMRIDDGQAAVDFDVTIGAFDDYDDVAVLEAAYSPTAAAYDLGGGILKQGTELLADIGVLKRYKDGWLGYNPQRMDALIAGGIYQTRDRINTLEEYIAVLETRLRKLEEGD